MNSAHISADLREVSYLVLIPCMSFLYAESKHTLCNRTHPFFSRLQSIVCVRMPLIET